MAFVTEMPQVTVKTAGMTRITKMTGIITMGRLRMSVPYVATISHRGTARKLKQEQKKKWIKGNGEEESFATDSVPLLIDSA